MSDTYIAAAIAAPELIDFEGVTYQLAPWDTIEVCAGFERFSIRQALGQIERLRPDMASELSEHTLYSNLKDSVESKIAAGHFRYGNSGYSQAQSTPLGMEEVLFYCLRVYHRDLARDVVKRMMASEQAIQILGALQRVSSPKVTTPASPTR